MPGHRRSAAWISFHAMALVGFMYEIGLETQLGIFIYAFMGCWVWLFPGVTGSGIRNPIVHPSSKSTPI